ncbi:MAG: tyrosine-type recombinase/integrase [Anaerolineaceae bacterium]|nr:tyrosine-type recombinase/integrase [Anaerolineaceae bacterium]MDD4577449.1 tyrosine-type recombinase/integrase [Anaerolineaceae bacterium]
MLIREVIDKYLNSVKLSRSANTYRTYSNAMRLFADVLVSNGVDVETSPIDLLKEDAVIWMANALKEFSSATEQVYMTAVVGLFEYIAGENLAPINLPRVRLLVKQRTRRPGIRLPQFPKSDIEKVLDYAEKLNLKPAESTEERLINLRDRAFLITLADTGLRVHEACNLRRGDIDWHESRAIIIGKGNKEAVLRFSKRSLTAMKEYLQSRAELDGVGGKALASLPVFARHDKAVGKKIKLISTTTGRAIVRDRVRECLGEDSVGTITPHSFRHYFVTTILGSSGNLKLAQVLARHTNIAVTQRYSHLADDELDQKYQEIFDDKGLSS